VVVVVADDIVHVTSCHRYFLCQILVLLLLLLAVLLLLLLLLLLVCLLSLCTCVKRISTHQLRLLLTSAPLVPPVYGETEHQSESDSAAPTIGYQRIAQCDSDAINSRDCALA
jgi:hypothetical protein